MWKEAWDEAYSNATFYSSKENTSGFWDAVAARSEDMSNDGSDSEPVKTLKDYLKSIGVLGKDKTMLDVGCGTGDYSIGFSHDFGRIAAIDYSARMISVAEKRAREKNCDNIVFICDDFNTCSFNEKYDIVLAALNPGVYSSFAFDKLSSLANDMVILLNQDGDVEASRSEPIYAGSHLADYPINYAKEKGISVSTLPYEYRVKTKEQKEVSIQLMFSFYKLRQ
ncbi:MAG: class I SAM-dependent methyltransferase [Lentihominibacter sp.]